MRTGRIEQPSPPDTTGGGCPRRCGRRRSGCRSARAPSANSRSRRTWPPWVWPDSVSATRAGTRGKMSGSCASRMTGASSVTLASVPRDRRRPRTCAGRALRRRDERHLVAEAGEPEAAAVLDEARDVVLVDGDAVALQHAPAEHGALARALGREVVPPVVVAEDGVHAERRLEPAQRLGPFLRRDGAGLELVAGGEVAEQHDDVGLERVGVLDDGADALGGHGRAAGVHVGDDADLELEIARPVGRGDAVARDLEPPASARRRSRSSTSRPCRRRRARASSGTCGGRCVSSVDALNVSSRQSRALAPRERTTTIVAASDEQMQPDARPCHLPSSRRRPAAGLSGGKGWKVCGAQRNAISTAWQLRQQRG